jgi:pyruvate dehydrogenase E1 component alpha subunit
MLKIRKVEEKIAELYPEQEMRCPTHLYIGQEAIATGVCANLLRDDYVLGTYRGHGIYLAKGGDLKAMLAELYGKRTGCAKGKGGSMHLVAYEVGFLGTSALVAGCISLAVGAALGSVMQRNNRVAVVFFGDAATEEGVFHESLNFASLKKLPVIFVCENNFYAVHSHLSARQASDNIYKRAEAHDMPGVRVDGNDVIAVFDAAQEATKRARAGEGPTLIECRTYRWKEHVGPYFDYDLGYRSKEELDEWIERCPLRRYEEFLLNHHIMSELEMNQIAEQIDDEIEEAVLFAKNSPFPDASELITDVYRT